MLTKIFHINDVTTDQIQFYSFGSSKNVFCIYEFQLEYNEGQVATSNFNSNISDEKREIYPLINGGEGMLDPIMSKSDRQSPPSTSF